MKMSYEQLMRSVTDNFINNNLDSSIYNNENLKVSLVEFYLQEFDLDSFLDDAEERLAEILEQNYRISI